MAKTKKKKICVVTGTRAEYGLLMPTIKAIAASEVLELQLVATGMHLSPEFGQTHCAIQEDGFSIDKKIEMLLSSDTSIGIVKSVGVGLLGFADAYSELRPDCVLLLGDRFEMLAAASAAMLMGIPIAHCHGGERTEGAFDEAIRHAITKMAHLHFVATYEFRKRVVQLGESPDRVFQVGAFGLEAIEHLPLMSQEDFEHSIGRPLLQRNLLVTFHPVTLETGAAAEQFSELLAALSSLPDTLLIFTKPNADTEGRILSDMVDDYAAANKNRAIAFTSLGQRRYLSALQYVDGVVGNSSSGLVEAPSFQIGTINIGDRQKGRIAGDSIIHCQPERQSILIALGQLYSPEFRARLREMRNPYKGEGLTSEKVVSVLEQADFEFLRKKTFFDLPFELTVD